MPEIILTDVTKRWGDFYAVDHLDLKIEDNAFVTLLGPSGCGKTTTLRMIAGLETPTSGRITIGDRVVFDSEAGINVPANKRKVGFLFQNYALWPNMTVYQNISFGLSNVKEPMEEVDYKYRNAKRTAEILADLKGFLAIFEECKTKNGKADTRRLYLKLIDTYIISMPTAKKLVSYGLQDEADAAAKAAEIIGRCNAVMEEQKKIAEKGGMTLSEDGSVLKNGSPVIKERKYNAEEIDLIVRRVSRIVKIGMFMDRYPAELSGGQQQRVAIARTLAPQPSVLFMDEPLSNLDAKLRLEMRSELQRLHLDTGSTFVYVTHDQMEAMTLATSICLIDNGVLQQYDAPLTVYSRPSNLFVADFVGNPAINFIDASGKQNEDGSIDLAMFSGAHATFVPSEKTDISEWNRADRELDEKAEAARRELNSRHGNIEKGNKDVRFRYHIAKVDEFELEEDAPITDGDFVLGVRPEAIRIAEKGNLQGEIYSSMPTGMETTVRIRIGNFLLNGVIFGKGTYDVGQKIGVEFGGNEVMLFSRRSGRIICTGELKVK